MPHCSVASPSDICIELNSLRPRRNRRHFADAIFKCIFVNENIWISIKISLKFVPTGPISNIPALVQMMAWRRPGDKPLSGPRMVRLSTHICVTRAQWIKFFENYVSHKLLSQLSIDVEFVYMIEFAFNLFGMCISGRGNGMDTLSELLTLCD